MLFFALPLQAKTYNKRFCGKNETSVFLAKTKGMPMHVFRGARQAQASRKAIKAEKVNLFLSRYRNGKKGAK
jgi:hypothetical protein